MTVRVRLLGDFVVTIDDRVVRAQDWPRRSAASLVKLLALRPEHRLHRERLVDALWPDLDLRDAGPRLHSAAHYARRTLRDPTAVVLSGESVSLFPDRDVLVDVEELERQASLALGAGDVAAARDAARLFTGELLPDDLYEPWTEDARSGLAVTVRAVLRLGGCWQELVRLEPTDAEAHLALVRSHLAAGDRASATRQVEWLAGAFARDLGDEPAAEPPELLGVRRVLAEGLAAPGQHGTPEDDEPSQLVRFCRTPDGVDIAYATSGAGPPLVKAANWMTHLDHDWRSPVWRHWLVGLSRRHTLVRYDERGCGLSDRLVDAHSLQTWVRDLETVVDAAGLDRFPLLGISQGAAVAVCYAAQHPDRVTRLVLYGGYAQGRNLRARSEDELRLSELEVDLARLGWGSDSPAFRQVFTAQFMPRASKELWEAFNELQRLSTSPSNAAAVLSFCSRLDVREEASRVRCPALVLHARHDHRPPFSQGRLLASTIPDCRFVVLESDNHILLADEPAWPVFLDEVERFLEEESGAPR